MQREASFLIPRLPNGQIHSFLFQASEKPRLLLPYGSLKNDWLCLRNDGFPALVDPPPHPGMDMDDSDGLRGKGLGEGSRLYLIQGLFHRHAPVVFPVNKENPGHLLSLLDYLLDFLDSPFDILHR